MTSRSQRETSALDNTKQFVNHPSEASNINREITHTIINTHIAVSVLTGEIKQKALASNV